MTENSRKVVIILYYTHEVVVFELDKLTNNLVTQTLDFGHIRNGPCQENYKERKRKRSFRFRNN